VLTILISFRILIVFGIAVLVGAVCGKFPRLDEQLCGARRSELRDTFEAALWQRTGHPEHVKIYLNLHVIMRIRNRNLIKKFFAKLLYVMCFIYIDILLKHTT
jgi:hypothetical protein